MKNTAVGAITEVENLRVSYEKDSVSEMRNSVELFASAVLNQVVPFPNSVDPSPEVLRFAVTHDIDATPLSSNTKPCMFVLPYGFRLIGVLVWKIFDRRK